MTSHHLFQTRPNSLGHMLHLGLCDLFGLPVRFGQLLQDHGKRLGVEPIEGTTPGAFPMVRDWLPWASEGWRDTGTLQCWAGGAYQHSGAYNVIEPLLTSLIDVSPKTGATRIDYVSARLLDAKYEMFISDRALAYDLIEHIKHWDGQMGIHGAPGCFPVTACLILFPKDHRRTMRALGVFKGSQLLGFNAFLRLATRRQSEDALVARKAA